MHCDVQIIDFNDYSLTEKHTLSDIIITDYIVTDTIFHGHNFSRSTLSGKFLIFRNVVDG